MGAYLSKPSVEKKSSDYADERFSYGVSGMQGWRVSMEDAHNCIPSLSEDSSLFGVYDGHGGSEVALYCAYHLADSLKDNAKFKENKLEEALIETFMSLDANIILKETIKELKVLADRSLEDGPPTSEDIRLKEEEELPEDNETALLHEEATMSIEELLKRYGQAANAMNSALSSSSLRKDDQVSSSLDEELGGSSLKDEHKAKKANNVDESIGSRRSESVNSSEIASSSTISSETVSKVDECSSSSNSALPLQSDEIDSSAIDKHKKSETDTESNIVPSSSSLNDENTEAVASSNVVTNSVDQVSSNTRTDIQTNKKIKEKLQKVKDKAKPVKLSLPDGEYVPEQELSDEESEDSFDSDESVDGSEENDSSDAEELEEEEEISREENESNGANDFSAATSEEPGKDSGTTAVVAVIKGHQLTVANAGDSRCVLCRANGVAFDMSDDHKPEDAKELARIQNAGGHVNIQGRVNGGLNLSRAIGDHCYKTNDKFSLENQMITALPDTRTVFLEPTDEFMVIACDGIWNVMTSQEVVDFVRGKLTQEGSNDLKLSSVCEDLFTKCLAPDTNGDGTGCDNMTCVIVKFKKDWIIKNQTGKSIKSIETKAKIDMNNVNNADGITNEIDLNKKQNINWKSEGVKRSIESNTKTEKVIGNDSKRPKIEV